VGPIMKNKQNKQYKDIQILIIPNFFQFFFTCLYKTIAGR